MMVLKINDWVAYRDFYDGPGKVTAVDEVKRIFRAEFLTEPSEEPPFDSVGSIETSDWLPFSGIEYIISDSGKIAELEKEYSGDIR